MSSSVIPYEWVQRHADVAVRLGWSLDKLLESSMIELRYEDSRDVIGSEQALLLCINTILASDDATLGMVSAGLPPSFPAIGLRMALGCANLDIAIQSLCRLYASSSAVRVRLQTEHDEAIISVGIDTTDERDAAYLEEVFLLWMFIQCLYFLGRAPPIFDVRVRDPSHFNLGSMHWGINGVVRHGSVTSFRFPRALLAAPSATRAGPHLMGACYEHWFNHIDGNVKRTDTSGYVSDAGFVRFADMVRGSGKSANTLRRSLRASGGGFREARQHALVDAATYRLCGGDESVETIAWDLGYSDARSFRRFLKNATGHTPRQVRDRRYVDLVPERFEARQLVRTISEQMEV